MSHREMILYNLGKVGLSSKESEVYYELVKTPLSNGSQIAKKLGYPRTSVYDVLSKLVDRGFIMPTQIGEITSYVPVEFSSILNGLKKEMDLATQILEKELQDLESESVGTQFYNLNSEVGIKERIHQVLTGSQKEVYINTNMDMDEFARDFKELLDKKIRVLLFSFNDMSYEKYGVETYYRRGFGDRPEYISENKRILIVSDMKKAIIASNYNNGVFSGTYSENKLLVNVVAEHIHNDIYLMKFEKNSKGDFWKEVYLHTMQEIPE
ncbi:MAG: TrmB family transcriptional regulator [Fusobacteriaceae bacterium]